MIKNFIQAEAASRLDLIQALTLVDRDWVDYATALGAAITPILVLLLAGVGWRIKDKLSRSQERERSAESRIRELEDKLREDHIETYNQLLEPFLMAFTSDAVFQNDPKFKGKNKDALSHGRLLTVEYRKVGYKLSLIASDEVLRAYNKLMQFFYNHASEGLEADQMLINTSHFVKLISELMLEIRKSMGNSHTKLDSWEMIEWFMAETERMKGLSKQPPK